MRISDWSSDVCSSDLLAELHTYPDGSRRVAITLDPAAPLGVPLSASGAYPLEIVAQDSSGRPLGRLLTHVLVEPQRDDESPPLSVAVLAEIGAEPRSEEHTSELQSLMRISYAVFCLTNKNNNITCTPHLTTTH